MKPPPTGLFWPFFGRYPNNVAFVAPVDVCWATAYAASGALDTLPPVTCWPAELKKSMPPNVALLSGSHGGVIAVAPWTAAGAAAPADIAPMPTGANRASAATMAPITPRIQRWLNFIADCPLGSDWVRTC